MNKYKPSYKQPPGKQRELAIAREYKSAVKGQIVFTSEEQIKQAQDIILKSFPKCAGSWTKSQEELFNKFRLARDKYRNAEMLKPKMFGSRVLGEIVDTTTQSTIGSVGAIIGIAIHCPAWLVFPCTFTPLVWAGCTNDNSSFPSSDTKTSLLNRSIDYVRNLTDQRKQPSWARGKTTKP